MALAWTTQGMLPGIPEAVAYISVLILSGNALSAKVAGGQVGNRLVDSFLAATAWVVYFSLAFEGFGRLNLVTLALSVAGLWGLRSRQHLRTLFLAVIVLYPLLVPFSYAFRTEVGGGNRYELSMENLSNTVSRGAESFGAVGSETSHLLEGLRLITEQPQSAYAQAVRFPGSTYLDALVAPVPRAWWPEKPLGLGRSIVEMYNIRGVGPGFSLAVSWWGEAALNFGGLAFLAGPAMLWLVIKSLQLLQRFGSPAMQALTIALIVGAPLDLIWGGAFTFTSRFIPRFVVGFGLLGLAKAIDKVIIRTRNRRLVSSRWLSRDSAPDHWDQSGATR